MVLDCVLVPSATTFVEVYGPKFSMFSLIPSDHLKSKFSMQVFFPVRSRPFGYLRFIGLRDIRSLGLC